MDVGLPDANPGPEREDSRGAGVIVARLGHCLVEEPGVVPHGHGEFEHDVGALDPRRNLLHQRPQQRAGSLRVASEAMEPGGPQPAGPSKSRILGGQLGGELAELCTGSGGSARRGMLGRNVQLGGDGRIGRVCCSGAVSRSLLDIAGHPGKRTMHVTAASGVAASCSTEANNGCTNRTRASAISTTPSRSLIEQLDRPLSLAVRRRDHFDCRTAAERSDEENIADVPRQSRKAHAEELAEIARHREMLAGTRSGTDASELAAELYGEERVTSSGLVDPQELWPQNIEPESITEQVVKRTDAQRTERQLLQPRLGKATLEIDRDRDHLRHACGRQQTNPFITQTRSAT